MRNWFLADDGLGARRAMKTRRGQSLVEFAVVALVIYMLLAAMLTFGHALYVGQGLQSAADLGAREISRTPLPPDMNLDDAENPGDENAGGAIHHSKVRLRVFDEAMLVIDLDAFYAQFPSANPNIFADLVPTLPLLNQQLVTLMIVDRPDFDGDGIPDARLLRYPGALLQRTNAISPPDGATFEQNSPYASSGSYKPWVASNYVVGIPLLGDRWLPVIEEIDTERTAADNTGPNADPFHIESNQRGVVALRINFPFQSASMSSFQWDPNTPFTPNIADPVIADDSTVGSLDGIPGQLIPQPLVRAPTRPEDGPTYAGTYGGTYGLGVQGALGRQVRPYRRVISAQAIYRREVFE